jgi:hypothetical protein
MVNKMVDNMEQLEKQVLQMLLEGDEPTLETLRNQFQQAKRICREMSGTGFFTYFELPKDVKRLPKNVTLRFGDVIAEIEGLKHGAGFVLFVDDGLLTMLEGYSYDEEWPSLISSYALSYTNKDCRDLQSLCRTTGWPTQSNLGGTFLP